MPKICVNAEIQTKPCQGTVFSREIKCKAGQSNTCLRHCNEKCPAYKPRESVNALAAAAREVSFPQYAPPHAVRTTYPPPVAVSRPSSGNCGTCGGGSK